jgi:DNA mismatch repair protein MSH5
VSSCAAINGINQAIVSRANELAALSARGENLIAACAVLSAEETQVLGEAVRSSTLFQWCIC